MGQATADLPDITQVKPTPVTNADDVLSQLAGEEIDRMMASADLPVDSKSSADSADVDTLIASAGAPEPVEAIDSTPVSAELDKLFTELDGSATSPNFEPGPSQVAEPPSAAAEVAAELMADHKSSPLAPQLINDKIPFYLMPLEWINAPLDRLSPNARELIGKIAIITFVNAIAVVAYVLIFRR